MTLLFQSEQHDEFGTWPLAYIPYGGADFGEIQAVAAAVGGGDDAVFYQEWVAIGDRLAGDAEQAAQAGHTVSARELYLRASAYYATAYHPLYGAPVDHRLVAAFNKQMAAFDAGMSLGTPPVTQIRIPYEGITLPGYLIPGHGRGDEPAPLIIFTNGYDATITDMYFASAVAASRRGYHCLLFDGPGQGELLYEHNVPMRPDWEAVIGAVVDLAISKPMVDTDRIALSGWSLGGYLAPRGASGEHRLAAVIADPGQWDIGDSARKFVTAMGAPSASTLDVETLDGRILDRMTEMVNADDSMRWRIVDRGFWVNGVSDLQSFLETTLQYTLADKGGKITCPVLVTAAENDPLAANVDTFVEKLGERVTVLRFTAAEGAGEHCEMTNRTLLNRRVLDWLDDTLRDTSTENET